MTTNRELDFVSNKYIKAVDDDSIIYYHGEYRNINDILLEGISDTNRDVVIKYIATEDVRPMVTSVTPKPKDNVDFHYDIDRSDNRELTIEEICSYIEAIRTNVGFKGDLNRKQICTIYAMLVYNMMMGDIDVSNFRRMKEYLNGVIA